MEDMHRDGNNEPSLFYITSLQPASNYILENKEGGHLPAFFAGNISSRHYLSFSPSSE
jgi:hypothetical protein